MSPEVEQAILDFCLVFPTKGSQFVANQLRLQGTEVSPSGVRGVWQRHDLLKRHQRLLRLEAQARNTVADGSGVGELLNLYRQST